MSPLVSSVASIRTSVPVQTRSLSTLLITYVYLLRAVLLIKAASTKDGKVPKTPGPPSLPPVGAMHTLPLVPPCTLGQVVHKETAM